jgi:hypothetical protein
VLVRTLAEQSPIAADMVRAAKIGWSIGRYEERAGLAVPGLTHYLVHAGRGNCFRSSASATPCPTNFAFEVGYYISRTDEVPEPV